MNKIISFKSGLKLAFHNLKNTKSVAIGVYVGTGSAAETPETNGISHFIEHMVFKGTDKRSAYGIADEMESAGAQINAFTSREVTSFYTVSVNEHAEKCFDMLSDIFFNPSFSEENLKKEKGVVSEEIDMCEDDPSDVCNDLINEAYFGTKGLGYTILGTKKNVKSFTEAALREYMKQFYTPDNTIISVAGDITFDEAKTLCETYFETEFAKREYNREPLEISHETKSGSLKKKKPIEQAHIAFAFPSYHYDHPKTLAASLIAYVLGGGMSSRLFQKLREEKGLVYDVYASPAAYEGVGMFEIYLATNPAAAEEAVSAVGEVLREFLKNGMTEKEFLKGREQLKTSLVLGAERSITIMRSMGYRAIKTGKLFDINDSLKKLDNLKFEEMQTVAADIFIFDKTASAYVGKEIDFDTRKKLIDSVFNKE